jgi:GTP-binding protein Era
VSGTSGERFRCGLVTLAGRANVGKSTLLNAMVGTKVSIVSDKPQTTRTPVRAVLTAGQAQAVFVDTPGLHKPRAPLGQRLNRAALSALQGTDVTVFVVDGKSGVGGGDRYVADHLAQRHICVLNKTDGVARAEVLKQLAGLGEWGFQDYFAVSARTGAGVGALVEAILARLPEGPWLYPAGGGEPADGGEAEPSAQRDMGEAEWVAELVREQLLALTREELPYSIACQVTEWEWPYVRCEVLVEKESQKGIVIGQGGQLLKRVGTAVRSQLPPGAYLDLTVKVARDWQHRPEMLDRMGL